jgi:hypothetical protein
MTDNELIEEFYVSHGGKPSVKADIYFYSSNWDMLMSVVDKIETLDDWYAINVDRSSVYVHIYQGHCDSFNRMDYGNSKIQTVFAAVVHFIIWHNKNK